MPPLLLRGAGLASGTSADVLVDDGRIASLEGVGAGEEHDLGGYLLLPAAAEPHAHLDKALLAERYPTPAGDIRLALEAVRAAYASMTDEDIRDRASRAVATAVGNGFTAIRTHVNCEAGIGARAVRAICELRDELADLVDIQVVAMLLPPITGSAGAPHRAILDEAIALGADVVGGAPEFDERPDDAVEYLVRTASEAGLPIDLHVDETTDAGVFHLERFAAEVLRYGLSGRATASHCVSLGQQAPARVSSAASALAAAGVGVVTLPQTNLLLQGRDEVTSQPRGLTAVKALRDAGVVVAGGGDNWRDPFNPLGRIDPLETAALLVAAAHYAPADAYAAISDAPRRLMGLRRVAVEPGSPADLLAVRAASIEEAVASAGPDRWVFRSGALVARTRAVRDVDPFGRIRDSRIPIRET